MTQGALGSSHTPSVQVSVGFVWRHIGQVELDAKGVPKFPALPRDPGLYLYDFGLDQEGRWLRYIGESKDLADRARQYRQASADGSRPARTARRMHRKLVEHLSGGGEITFFIATEVLIDGEPLSLGRKSARLLAESAAVVLAQRDEAVTLLNRDDELIAGVASPE